MAFMPRKSGASPGERPVYQERVITEATDLDARRDALKAFIQGPVFATVDIAEQARLKLQFQMMTGYAIVLRDRIAHFDPPA